MPVSHFSNSHFTFSSHSSPAPAVFFWWTMFFFSSLEETFGRWMPWACQLPWLIAGMGDAASSFCISAKHLCSKFFFCVVNCSCGGRSSMFLILKCWPWNVAKFFFLYGKIGNLFGPGHPEGGRGWLKGFFVFRLQQFLLETRLFEISVGVKGVKRYLLPRLVLLWGIVQYWGF